MGTNSNNGTSTTPLPPPSPGKLDLKRKGPEDDSESEGAKPAKRGRRIDAPGADGMVECPETACCKKYRHVNGLRYHLTHFHKKNLIFDEEGNMITEAPEEFIRPAPVSEAGRSSPKVRAGAKKGLEAKVASPKKMADSLEEVKASPKKGEEADNGKNKPKKGHHEHGKKMKPVVSVAPITTAMSVSMTTSVRTVTTASTVTTNTCASVDPKNGGKGVKNKSSKPSVSVANRPIMPAPTTLASVTTYPQVTVSNGTGPVGTGSQLKPIQPKPTVLGVAGSVDPALAASLKQMKQESKKSKKKKKDKSKKDHKEHPKPPHTSVIKATTVSIPTLPSLSSDGNSPNTQPGATAPPELHKQNLQPPPLDRQRLTPPELQTSGEHPSTPQRAHRPPSSLSLNSPAPPPPKEGEGEDIHSPAYSDISDANESVPVLENQTEAKNSRGRDSTTSSGVETQESVRKTRPEEVSEKLTNGQAGFGMFTGNYYGQPPYLTPAVTPESACGKSSHISGPPPAKPGENAAKNGASDKAAIGQDERKEGHSPAPPRREVTPDKRPGHYPPGMYMGGYPEGYVDPAYHMHLASNPEYKAQKEAWMREQERRCKEHLEQQKPVDMSAKGKGVSRPHPSLDGKAEQAADLSLKDKLNENKQILKENLELKAQMPPRDTGEDAKTLLERQQDELQSFYMYQQQRMLEHSRYMQKSQASPKLPLSSPKVPLPKEGRPTDKSNPASKTSNRPWHPDEEKDRPRSREADRAKAHEPRPQPSPKAEDGKHPSSSAALHPYAHYYPHYAAAGQLPFDPSSSHPSSIFPGSMVPYGSNPYMHPSQIRYPHPEDGEEKGRRVASPGGKDGSNKALDLLQQRASMYAGSAHGPSPQQPSHKIHELKEAGKGMDRSRTGSPAVKEEKMMDRSREGTPTSSKEEGKSRTNSPPTQRHLHTHHHTHVVGPAYPIYGHYPCEYKIHNLCLICIYPCLTTTTDSVSAKSNNSR